MLALNLVVSIIVVAETLDFLHLLFGNLTIFLRVNTKKYSKITDILDSVSSGL